MFYRYLLIPFISFFIMMFYAGLMGKERLVEYAIGLENNLAEEYIIIVFIVTIYTVIRHVIRIHNSSQDKI